MKKLLVIMLLLTSNLFAQGTGPVSVPFGIRVPVTAGAIGDTVRAALGDSLYEVFARALGDSLRVALGDSMRAALGDSSVVSRTGATITGTIVEDTNTGIPKLSGPQSSGTANTFGSWVEHDASMSADSWICMITCMITTDNQEPRVVLEVGVGAGANESTIVRISFDYEYTTDQKMANAMVFSLPIPIKVASGERLAVRVADDVAGAIHYYVGVQYYQGLE